MKAAVLVLLTALFPLAAPANATVQSGFYVGTVTGASDALLVGTDLHGTFSYDDATIGTPISANQAYFPNFLIGLLRLSGSFGDLYDGSAVADAYVTYTDDYRYYVEAKQTLIITAANSPGMSVLLTLDYGVATHLGVLPGNILQTGSLHAMLGNGAVLDAVLTNAGISDPSEANLPLPPAPPVPVVPVPEPASLSALALSLAAVASLRRRSAPRS